MESGEIPLFALADRRLAWVDRREALLSQNVANADTPGYKPRDMLPFDQALARAGMDLAPVRTDPAFLPNAAPRDDAGSVVLSGEQAPDGNAVSLDEQLVRIADTDSAHALVTNLYGKYLGMFRTAIGR